MKIMMMMLLFMITTPIIIIILTIIITSCNPCTARAYKETSWFYEIRSANISTQGRALYSLCKDVPVFGLDKQHGNLECQKNKFCLVKTFLLFDDPPLNSGPTITILMYLKIIYYRFSKFIVFDPGNN